LMLIFVSKVSIIMLYLFNLIIIFICISILLQTNCNYIVELRILDTSL